MGFDRFGLLTALAAGLFAVLAIPAAMLSAASWIARRGALMQMSGTRMQDA